MAASDEMFYQHLRPFDNFYHFPRESWYAPLPEDWYVAISDVKESTKAIGAGKYKEVNAMGVASIVAVLNAVKPLTIPYVFGGDGATFCIPPAKKNAVASALVAAHNMASGSFELSLRIGLVPVGVLHKAGAQVLVGKFQPSPYYSQAMFLGAGLRLAETLLKDPAPDNPYRISETEVSAAGDFTGFHCRWNEIPSPHEETITLLVQALAPDFEASNRIYAELLRRITEIYGHEEIHHPLREEKLVLVKSLRKLSTEARIVTSSLPKWRRRLYTLRALVYVHLGNFMMHNNIKSKRFDGGRYRQALIANTDYRKFDEVLRMVISGTEEHQRQLRTALEEFRRKGELVYGIQSSPHALITCIISDYTNDHVHFLDGSNGGYALAAREMKKQLEKSHAKRKKKT